MIKKLKNKLRADKHLSELLKGSSIAFILRITGIGLGYVFVLLVTRGYGAEAMGIFALSFTVLQIVSVISRLGMDTLLLRIVSANVNQNSGYQIIKNVYKKTLWVIIPISIIVSIILYFISPFIATVIFHKPEYTTAFHIVSFAILPMNILFIHREGLRGLKRIMLYSFFNSVAISLFASISLAVLIMFTSDNIMPLYAHVSTLIFVSFLSLVVWQRNISSYVDIENVLLNTKEKLMSLKEMLFISLPMMLAGSLYMIMSWTDTFMLGMFSSIEEVGVYNVVLKVATSASIVLMAINSISAPKFAEMWGKKDIKGLEKVVKQSTKLIFWASFPLLVLIWLLPLFILGLFGIQFEIGVLALILLSFGQFINAVSGSVNYLLNMTGYEKIVQYNIMIALIINIVLNYVLIPIYGINGAAFASLVSIMFWNLAGVAYIKYKFDFWTIYFPLLTKINRKRINCE